MNMLRRGEVRLANCGTPYCSGLEGRCWLCGMTWAECQCGSLEARCLCGARAESWRDVRPIHLSRLIGNNFRAVYEGIAYAFDCLREGSYSDLREAFWYFIDGWRGK